MKQRFENQEVQLTGKVLISVEKALQSLGIVGKNILKEHKIGVIDPEIMFPVSTRSEIFDTLLDRYGDPAVKALGFNMADYWTHNYGATLLEDIINKNKSDVPNTASKDFFYIGDNNIGTTLENYCFCLMQSWDIAIKSFCVTQDKTFTAYSNKISENSYQFYAKQPGVYSRHMVYNEINLNKQISYHISNVWDFKVVLNAEKTVDHKYGCAFVFDVSFFKRKVEIDIEKYSTKLKSDVINSFLSSVLLHSENQRVNLEDQKNVVQKQKDNLESLSGQLGKYIPPQIHDALFKGDYNTDITTRRKKLTVFFSDIKNFTKTSENLQPEDLTNYLNEYFSEMTKIALDLGATIDKYIGDAMMVFFGDPDTNGEREDARACVEMALRMQERMEELRSAWRHKGFSDPFEIRIGINTGYCNVGNFGSEQRLTYTIIGGEVNVAARLESASPPNGILMSYETYAHVQDMIDVEEKEAINMKGINREIKVFSFLARKSNVKTEASHIKKNLTKKKLSEIEKIKKDIQHINQKIDAILKKL